jgi:hypothetical protein
MLKKLGLQDGKFEASLGYTMSKEPKQTQKEQRTCMLPSP